MAIGFNIGSVIVVPDKNLGSSKRPRVLKAAFGDGYEQRLVDGINNIEETFSVSFVNRPKAEIDDIIAFFNSKKGVLSFDFVLPDSNNAGLERTIKVVCEDYNLTYTNHISYGCSASFRRVYEP